MNEIIQKALEALEQADVAGYFEEMDKIEIPPHKKPLYAELKDKFVQDLRSVHFYQQLKIFAKDVHAPENTPNTQNEAGSSKTIIQNAEKIYNIDKIDKADFN